MSRERVLAMRELWTKGVASYAGEFVRFQPSRMWPKPVAPGGPPILLGGFGGPVLCRHIAEYADGWLPVGGPAVAQGLPRVRAAVERAGRDPGALRVIPCGGFPLRPGRSTTTGTRASTRCC